MHVLALEVKRGKWSLVEYSVTGQSRVWHGSFDFVLVVTVEVHPGCCCIPNVCCVSAKRRLRFMASMAFLGILDPQSWPYLNR